MRFTRVFKSGGGDYDPRQHKVAEWKCDVCKYIHWQDHIDESTLDKLSEKKCPQCGSYSVQDRIHALKLRKTELIHKQVDIKKEIEALCSELEQIEVASESNAVQGAR